VFDAGYYICEAEGGAEVRILVFLSGYLIGACLLIRDPL
jgi:hypothetical protein